MVNAPQLFIFSYALKFLVLQFNKSDSTRQLTEILMECGASEVHILPTTLPSHADTIRELVVKWMREGRNLCVFNLCDGTETDG